MYPEFKFYSKEDNEIFDVYEIRFKKKRVIACCPGFMGNFTFSCGVLLPVLDLQLSDGTFYTQGDVIFIRNDDELWFREERDRKFINYETAKRFPKHLFVLMREELHYWWLYHSSGSSSGVNDDMYPAGWIQDECYRYRVKDNEGRNVNIYTHRDGLFPGLGGVK